MNFQQFCYYTEFCSAIISESFNYPGCNYMFFIYLFYIYLFIINILWVLRIKLIYLCFTVLISSGWISTLLIIAEERLKVVKTCRCVIINNKPKYDLSMCKIFHKHQYLASKHFFNWFVFSKTKARYHMNLQQHRSKTHVNVFICPAIESSPLFKFTARAFSSI